jgi:heptosyltransferase III
MNQSILVARQGALGDVILTTPIIRKIKEEVGATVDIDFVTQFPEVYQNNPQIHQVHNYEQHLTKEYNGFIDLNMVYEKSPKKHIIDAYSEFVFKSELKNKQPELFPSDKDKIQAQEIIQKINHKYIVLHMRANIGWPSRNFPIDFWHNVIGDILNKFDYDILIVGSLNDLSFNFSGRITDVRGQTNVHVTYELIRHAKALVTGDTAPLHIGSCTETPIIGLFTSVRHDYRQPLRQDRQFSPLFPILNHEELECYGCLATEPSPITNYTCRRGDLICLKSIPFSYVANELSRLT